MQMQSKRKEKIGSESLEGREKPKECDVKELRKKEKYVGKHVVCNWEGSRMNTKISLIGVRENSTSLLLFKLV